MDWKSVATFVKRAVAYGLRHRRRPPVHVIGIDEVSRRKDNRGSKVRALSSTQNRLPIIPHFAAALFDSLP